jgi:hypothetical protein
MPPQNNGQVPPKPPYPSSSGTGFSVDSLQKNQKFMETIKTFVIYGSIVYVINAVVGMIISTFDWSSHYSAFSISTIIMALIFGAIGSAVGGAVFFFLYDPIHNWVKRSGFLSRYIHDMFTLFWKPFLVGTIISAAFGLLGMLGLGAAMVAVTAGYGAASFGGLFIGWIITFVAHIVVYYWYSKTVSAKLTPFYPW